MGTEPYLSMFSVTVVLFLPLFFDFCFGRNVDFLSNNLDVLASKDTVLKINKQNSQFFYRNNKELEEYLKLLAEKCKSIMRLYSIGTSVLGYPLWVLEISDKPGEREAEPAFKYVGNLHGDEPVGRELLLLLGTWICDNHMEDPLATYIVRGVHLHLLPSMNPDGFDRRSRNNAHNIDLNRDFPDQFLHHNDNEDSCQPETKAIMNWTRKNNFVASASLHGGAMVANYPWDGTSDGRTRYSPCDDDKTFQYLAEIYSRSHPYMHQSVEFRNGITNGAAWYPLYGGMQDWNYIHGKCMDLTLEISEEKWPPDNKLSEIWEANRLSMLQLIASVIKCGIHGQVVSSLTGSPLAASISVKGINFTVFATEEYGDYHRLLSPGQAYEVSASMAGYHSQTASIFVHEGKSSRLDFSLEPSDPHPNVVQSRNNSAVSSMKDIHQEEKNTTAHEVQKRLYKESLRTEFFLGKGQLKVAYDKLVTVPLLADFCLMLAVLLLCILFVCRYRARSLRS